MGMEGYQNVLLAVWREACRHIEITQSTETIAGLLLVLVGVCTAAFFVFRASVRVVGDSPGQSNAVEPPEAPSDERFVIDE